MELGASLPPGQLGSGETRLSGSGGSFSEGRSRQEAQSALALYENGRLPPSLCKKPEEIYPPVFSVRACWASEGTAH